MNRKIKSLLSLTQKAGKIVTGEDSCERAIQNKSAMLVIVAEDASDNTKKKFINKTKFYNVDCFVFSTKEELSNTIGKKNRATLVITEMNLAEKIKVLLQQDEL